MPKTSIIYPQSYTDKNERRSAHRKRVFKGCTIEFNDGNSVYQGVVRNQSDSGALLAFSNSVGLPKRFNITTFGEASHRPAEVCWQHLNFVGIRYLS